MLQNHGEGESLRMALREAANGRKDGAAWAQSGVMDIKILCKMARGELVATEEMKYDQDRQQLRSALDHAGVEVYMKVTHIFRAMLAEMLSMLGTPLHEIGMLQLWEVGEVMLSRYVGSYTHIYIHIYVHIHTNLYIPCLSSFPPIYSTPSLHLFSHTPITGTSSTSPSRPCTTPPA